MRAAVFAGAGKPLAVENVADPEPGPGEVIIKVHRCGICGSDIHMTSEHTPFYPAGSVIGHEFAGEVVALGRGVEKLKVGQRITAMPVAGCGRCAACLAGWPLACEQAQTMVGGFAEYTRAAEASAIVLPQTVSMADGALIEPLAVGLHGASAANMTPGARVLVIGAGSVALSAIYWCHRLGAGRIAVLSRSMRNSDIARTFGARAFELVGEGEAERIADALGGPPDIVFECAGAVGLTQKAVELVRLGGTVMSMGFCAQPDPIVPMVATWRQITMKFTFAYGLADFQYCADTLDSGVIEPRLMLSDAISLDELPVKFEAIRAGRAPEVKVQVDPWKA